MVRVLLAEQKTPKCKLPCFGVFLLVGTSYGNLISLPVRHPFDSHPTLQYIAAVPLVPCAVGITYVGVGVP